MRERLVDVCRRPGVKARHAAQEVVIGVEAFGRLALCAFDFGAFKLMRDRADDALGDPILKLEDVVERAFIALGPEMAAGRCIDELSGNAHAVRRFADAAFQHIAHAQVAADLLHIDGPALVGEARIARDHEQPAYVRQAP